jgi:hypothetical protein
MTWLGLVAAVTMITGFGGMSLLSVLGVSLRAQGTHTTRQSWNRRMLCLGAVAVGVALLLAFSLAGPLAGLVCIIGCVTLGVLVAAMFSSRYPTRLLSVLLFLTVALAAATRLPPRGGTFDGVAAFVVLGLLLAKMSRVMIRRLENETGFT